MRKKLSLLLLLLLIPTLAYAWGVMIVGGGVPAGVSDGLIGHNCGDTSNKVACSPADTGASHNYTTTTPGTIGYVHVYLSYLDANSNFNVAIYNSDGSTKLAESNLKSCSASQWYSFTLDSTIVITAATVYKLIVGSKDDTDWRYASAALDANSTYYSWTLDVEDTMPATINDTTGSSESYDLCIYADNTP